MELINVNGVSKKFMKDGKEFYALRDISFRIEEGEIFSVLGPNGAGKTTLLNIMMGILIPDSGSVRIFGKNAGSSDVMERIAYVSGEERFHWALTVKDILNFASILYGVSNKKGRVSEIVDFFGLQNVFNSRFEVLSTGEKMRLAFAHAVIGSPKILFLDEPTLGMDPDISIKVRKRIKSINKDFKTTIILTSHYMKEVEFLSSRVAFINKGKLIDINTVKGIKRGYPDLERYFMGMVGDEAA
ncbi:ABC transporter ATP-binding protein [Candidatus Woesearchaeota archaeon]|nr:ABC transporter ATP-binding protein [Candidatus Woesearchaeota archaeon]